MPRRPQPSRITVGGVEAVALPVAEYEQLLASRRQVGGQSARIRALSERLRRTEQMLSDLEATLSGTAAASGDADRLRRAVAELLRRHREASV
jgi:CRP-like cAMP-binding protein